MAYHLFAERKGIVIEDLGYYQSLCVAYNAAKMYNILHGSKSYGSTVAVGRALDLWGKAYFGLVTVTVK